MTRLYDFESESFEGNIGEWQQEGKSDPAWQAAWRFATAIRKQGFLPKKHFVDRVAQRGIGEGTRFDPRTFRKEFFSAQHYRQTRPGYNTRIAVVRGIPLLYRLGGPRGNTVVLAGALPEGGLPPVESVAPPPQREAGIPESEVQRPSIPGQGQTTPVDPIRQSLIRAATAISNAALKASQGDRQGTLAALLRAIAALRRVPASRVAWATSLLETALNALQQNQGDQAATLLQRAHQALRQAM